MTFLTQFHTITNGDFIGRVNLACLTAASQIIEEAEFSWEDPISARHRLAANVARGYQNGLDNFVRACAMNPTIAAAEEHEANSSADNDLVYVVSSNWNAIADIVSHA